MIKPFITEELVCTRCGQRSGSVYARCWCGGRARARVPVSIARAMRQQLPADDLLERVRVSSDPSYVSQRRALMDAAAGTVQHRGTSYALTWEGCPWCGGGQHVFP